LLTSAIKYQIEQGKFAVGSSLPTEAILCEQFNVSRHTVREALRELRRLGLVASRQGSGSVVIAKSVNTSYTHAVNNMDDLMGMHQQTQRKILSTDIVPLESSLAETIQANTKQLWVSIAILHSLQKNPSPIMYSICYIDAKYSEIQKSYNGKQILIEQLQEMYGVKFAKIHQEIQAAALNKKESEILKCKIGAPALKATRFYYGQDQALICISVNISPGDRYVYSTHFQLNDSL